MKSFHQYVKEWEKNAKKDPYWSVLTASEYEHTQWNRARFFQTGTLEIETLKQYIEQNALPIPFTGIALDFGCGVGRLTQALAPHFQEVFGIDIAENMLSEAYRALGTSVQNIHYLHNPHPHLKLFSDNSFDFIYSNVVIQHISTANQLIYLREFVRILKPGGWMVIQIPSAKIDRTLTQKVRSAITRSVS